MNTLEQLLEDFGDDSFVIIVKATTEEKVYIDDKLLENGSITGYLRKGAYYMLPKIVCYLPPIWEKIETKLNTAYSLIGYEEEDIHLIIDTKPEDVNELSIEELELNKKALKKIQEMANKIEEKNFNLHCN